VTPRRAEVGIVYLAGLAQGLSLVTFPAVSAIFTDPKGYRLTNSEYGSLFAPMVVLAVAGSSLGARGARLRGLKWVFVAGLCFNLASMAILTLSQWFVGWHGVAYRLLLAATAALGAGFGTTLMALNTYVAGFFPQKSEAALPALHAFLGTGTTLAPVLVVVFVGTAVWWLLPLGVSAGFLVLALASLTQPLATASPGRTARAGGSAAPRRRIPARLPVYAAVVFLYGICETVFGNWAAIYLKTEVRVPLYWAELALSAFWAMVTAGRIAVAIISAWVDARWIYAALPVLILMAFLGIPRVGGAAAANVLAFGFAGVACSAFFPLSISLAEQEFSRVAAAVSGGLVAAYMAGYGVGAFGVGPIRDAGHLALSTVYTDTSVLAAGMAVVAFVLAWPRRDPAHGTQLREGSDDDPAR
jgi:fucose permease